MCPLYCYLGRDGKDLGFEKSTESEKKNEKEVEKIVEKKDPEKCSKKYVGKRKKFFLEKNERLTSSLKKCLDWEVPIVVTFWDDAA